MRSFIDTNLLVYADSGDEPAKQRVALTTIRQLLESGDGVVSTQVLQEYVNVALRKLQLPPALVRQRLALYRRFDMVATTAESIDAALDLTVLRSLSFYDALIVQAAQRSGCARLLSEDMQTGAVLGGVEIVNPFLGAEAAAPASTPTLPRTRKAPAKR